MRIAIVNRYFWPESVLVNDISRWLAESGHDIEVLTGQPDYNPEVNFSQHTGNETWNGVYIRRISPVRSAGRGVMRNLGSLLYVVQCSLIILFGKKWDVVWLTSIPPIVQPLLIRVVTAVRGTKLVYFPQDIYPEIAVSSDLLSEGFLSRLLCAVDSWVIRHSDRVVTISHDMADYLKSRCNLDKAPVVIRSFSPVQKPRPPMQSETPDRPLRFVFAGNIGRFQNLDALVEAFAKVNSNDAVLEFLGNGRERSRLEKLVRDRGITSIRFHDFLPVEQAFGFVAHCHIGVISLRPGIFRYAFPAKTYTYIGAGLPLLVFVETASELSRIVRERGIGVAVSWDESVVSIVSQITDLMENYRSYQMRVYKNTDDLYLTKHAQQQWLDVFEDLAADRGRK
jgi:colanic acid biosynthesis glycosyl transferase WcaI